MLLHCINWTACSRCSQQTISFSFPAVAIAALASNLSPATQNLLLSRTSTPWRRRCQHSICNGQSTCSSKIILCLHPLFCQTVIIIYGLDALQTLSNFFILKLHLHTLPDPPPILLLIRCLNYKCVCGGALPLTARRDCCWTLKNGFHPFKQI